MLKVLMTTDAVGGVWTYALELCRALEPLDVQVVLATMGPPPSHDQRHDAAAISNITLVVSHFQLEWMTDPWTDVERAGHWLLELERQTQPDIIHLNGYAHGNLDWQAPVMIVAHSCVLSWWEAVKRTPLPDEWLTYAATVSRGLRAANLVVAPTHAMLDALRRHYRRLPQTDVIPNGRDPSAYRRRRKEAYILSAGRLWDEAKNIVALDDIAPRLRWPVRVAGETARTDGSTASFSSVERLGALDPVSLAGQMSRASIYALPARYEPFGLSALEAGLSGCALVLGDIESLREVWGDAALFVPLDDSKALLRTLTRLIDSEDLRTAMGERARGRALQYTPQRMAEAYLHAYAQLRNVLTPTDVPADLQATRG
jgi:glycosyltransferase involved in cell wall biosynthesis